MPVVKVIELLGESEKGFEDAVAQAVAEAGKTIDHISGVEVANLTANVENGRIREYKANVRVAFMVDSNRRGKA